MCGIVGGIGNGIGRVLLNGLRRLEYRGYDSAGIALAKNGGIKRLVVAGRVSQLRRAARGLDGTIGIGHTRWATHGVPSEKNAHPIVVGSVAIVHNGIIENYAELREELKKEKCRFNTDTDSEVIAHLINRRLSAGDKLADALCHAAQRLQGAYAVAALQAGSTQIACARQGNPLMVGFGNDGAVFLSSDGLAIADNASQAIYMEDGDFALFSEKGVEIFDIERRTVKRSKCLLENTAEVSLGEHRHFMKKEIFEQPEATAATMERYLSHPVLSCADFGRGAIILFRKIKRVNFIACGSSYHATMTACHWLRSFGLPCHTAIASEYRYGDDPEAADGLTVAVSQSGETADTLAAMRIAKTRGAITMALVNVPTSTMAREADFVLPTRAGAEIGVASTKTFTAQLSLLALLALALAKAQGRLNADGEQQTLRALHLLPHLLRKILLCETQIRRWARKFAVAQSALFIGRRTHYPLALEGALKLKEISYIHAEGCAAGELKHGVLALVDTDMPVVALAPDNDLQGKMNSNLQEIAARGGRLYVIAGANFNMPKTEILRIVDDGGAFLSPLTYALPLQLLAYHTALQKGTDIDKPRNLAKSVTVE